MTPHDILIHKVTSYDRRLGGGSPSRLALLFQAVDRAELHPGGIVAGVEENFNDPLASQLIRAVGKGKIT